MGDSFVPTAPSPFAAAILKPQHRSKRAILLKGPSGSGKTYQFRTLLQGGMKGLYAHVNEHYESISDLDFDMLPLKKLDVPLLPRERDAEKQDLIKLVDGIKSGAHNYDFIYVDSLMRYAEDLVYYLQYERVPAYTGFEMWRMFGEKMRRALRELVSLTEVNLPKPVHVICTWGVEVAQDWEGKRAIVPVVDGKMVGPRIDYAFDDVLMLRRQPKDTGGAEYVAYTSGNGEFDAKVSAGAQRLPPVIAEPNLFRILQKIQSPG